MNHLRYRPPSSGRAARPRVFAIVALGVLVSAFALVPACADAPEEFCQTFCAAYVDCLDAGQGSGGSAPDARALFCGGVQDRRRDRCETSCLSTVDLLASESRSFRRCASCVLDASNGDGICSRDVAIGVGQLSCSDACDEGNTLESASYFYGKLEEDVVSDTVCQRPGVETWDASDPAIGHRMGAAGPDGSWVCDPCDTSWHVFYGPTLPTLPPGRYRAGARDVRLTGGTPTGMVGVLEVGYEPDTWPFQVTLGPSDFSGGIATEVAVDFELTAEKVNVQPRWSYYADNGATGVTIGRIFVERK